MQGHKHMPHVAALKLCPPLGQKFLRRFFLSKQSHNTIPLKRQASVNVYSFAINLFIQIILPDAICRNHKMPSAGANPRLYQQLLNPEHFYLTGNAVSC